MTPQHAILLCLLAPLVGALGSLGLYQFRRTSIGISIAALGISLAAAVWLVAVTANGEAHAIHAGGWPAPFGIVLVADGFAALMLAVCQLVTLGALVFCVFTLPPRYRRQHVLPLVQTLSFGTCGAFLTGDLFNLYVWFEVLLLSSFSLMSIMPGKAGREGTWRYVVINLVSSLLFLAAAGLIYGQTGTLNFADLRLRFAETADPVLIESSLAILFGAFAIKAALVPLAFWLPASYPHLPPALGALFAGLLTKVGLYAMYRVATMVFAYDGAFPHREILLLVALATMIFGVLGAIGQSTMRGILSFHIISQVGYMALALALFSPLAIAGGIFYLVHHIVVKANLFLVTAMVEDQAGSSDLARTRGVLHGSPMVALLFAIPALSLAGLPPLSGFFAKFALLRASIDLGDAVSAGFIVVVGLLTFFSMLKIWRAIFWGEPDPPTMRRANPTLALTSGVMGLVTVAIGLACGPFFDLAENAARGLLEPAAYLDAVLGTSNPDAP
jgi:multicomponent Na+:H+ antiporter subunit D